MREELEKKLEEEFPFMKKGASLEEQESDGYISDLYSAFGMSCGDGWYELIHDLCFEIMTAYKDNNKPFDIVIDQVKEKYGTLRFYYHFEGQEKCIHAFDMIGGGGIRITPKGDDFKELISEIVRKYEDKSSTVCERCGKPGILRNDRPLIQTLCDSCASKRHN